MDKVTRELELECILTDDELMIKGKELSRVNQEKSSLEDEKKARLSKYTADIKACEADIGVLSLAISNRRERRMVECEIKYNEPVAGQKTIIRLDSKEIHKIETMSEAENGDMFINALGDQQDSFVFRDRRAVDLIDQAECKPEDGDKWQSLGQPAAPQALITAPIEKDKNYRVIRGVDEDTGKTLYQLQLYKVVAEKGSEDTLPLEDNKEDVGDFGKTFVFPGGRDMVIEEFDSVEPEVVEAHKQGNLMIGGTKDGKVVPYTKIEVLKVALPDCECKVVRGGTAKVPGYYIIKYPDKPLKDKPEAKAKAEDKSEPVELCGQFHKDGERTCRRELGHDGRHFYGDKGKKLEMGDKPEDAVETSPPDSEPDKPAVEEKISESTMPRPLADNFAAEGITIEDAETYLRARGQLGETATIETNPKLEALIREKWIHFINDVKEFKAKNAAA